MNLSALDWQKKIYLDGFTGKRPVVPVDPSALELAAKAVMSPKAFAYVAGGAGAGVTIQSNREAFTSVQIVPRMLRNVGVRNTSISLFGKSIPSPLLLSPVGVLELAHRDADLAVARVAAALGVPYIFSNQASVPMEKCAAAMGASPRWFQLYWSKSQDLVASFVQRAERCGCDAIVVTLDTTMLGWRTRDLDLAYLPFLEGKGIAQYTSDPVFQKMLDEADDSPEVKRELSWDSVFGLIRMVKNYPGNGFFAKLKSGRPIKAVRKFVGTYSNPSTSWDDLKFLRQHTKLPIVLKGILHPEDAAKAVDYGVDGIVISNHGGRQVDGAISTFGALPKIARAVNHRVPILLDSGVRTGADMFKAIALGATAVCIGRPYVYGLALAGERGVCEVVRNLMADFELTMGLAGCRSISEINLECLAPG
ncbi:MAG TPA: alpha-hydroxy-acid oxidizing protein [Chryseosolibacter sp.]